MGDFCIVCRRKLRVGILFCRSCQRSYDSAMGQDATIAGVVEWTASRVYRLNKHRHPTPEAGKGERT